MSYTQGSTLIPGPYWLGRWKPHLQTWGERGMMLWSVAAVPGGGSWRDMITVCTWVGVGWLPDKLHDTLLNPNIRQAMNNFVSVSMSHRLHGT